MVPREPLWQYAPYTIKVRAGRMALKMWPHGCDDGTRGGDCYLSGLRPPGVGLRLCFKK